MLLKCLDTAMVGKTMDCGACTYYVFLWLLSQGLFSSGSRSRQATHSQASVPASKNVGQILGSMGLTVHSRVIQLRGPTSIPTPTVPLKIEAFSVYAG